MGDLPLQRTRPPWPPQLWRWTLLCVLALAVLLLGLLAPRRTAVARPLLGGPGQEMAYAREARRLIDRAEQRIWLAMYVLRPDDGPVGGLLDGLAAAAARGVDVRVCLDLGQERDGEPDLKHEAAAAWLAARGVRVILDEDRVTSHAKVMVVDGRFVLSGSHNWTRSALVANRELSWLVEDAATVDGIEAWLAAIPGWSTPAR